MNDSGPFARVLGQEPAITTLLRALDGNRVHHAYRFEGPAGTGKELAAFALAQSLVCTEPGPLACTECSACRRALTLADDEPRVPVHPDVLLLARGLYPASILGKSETANIGVEQVRRIVLERAGYPPHEGRALVVIVRDADELTPSAANAMLKTLEEPGDRTHFVLLTSRPNRLLDTIRSRTLAVRFGPLPDAVIAELLAARGLPADAAQLAGGSMERALELTDEEVRSARQDFVSAALAAIDAPDLASALKLADRRSERHVLRTQLEALASELALRGRAAAADDPAEAARCAARYDVVMRAAEEVERNASPALAVEAMVGRLRRAC